MAAYKTLTQWQITSSSHELITWFGDISGDTRAVHSPDEGGVTAITFYFSKITAETKEK